MHIERLTGSFDAELRGVTPVDAVPQDGRLNETAGLLQQKVQFELDSDIFRPDYMTLYLRFVGWRTYE
ncbi:hypothetical protein [Pseudomonas akapageensis]|uniref:hypothetical protein n=1 Tax=Pseudomonas akapageensis TaxID=2609961 RepID=UPI0014085242|nr:hypothetical protein [Pseudomonas akapageensis]